MVLRHPHVCDPRRQSQCEAALEGPYAARQRHPQVGCDDAFHRHALGGGGDSRRRRSPAAGSSRLGAALYGAEVGALIAYPCSPFALSSLSPVTIDEGEGPNRGTASRSRLVQNGSLDARSRRISLMFRLTKCFVCDAFGNENYRYLSQGPMQNGSCESEWRSRVPGADNCPKT